ncbi:cytochrome P450 [Bosea psychrotolerans]|uniref:Cytochrome P450 n=2 Tax=Bosea psychrotolerans TaxID=1871628 RepID=A0A2S4MD22_9HYPH|nr:cytochrome P450 [Bosea psychrotolerans]
MNRETEALTMMADAAAEIAPEIPFRSRRSSLAVLTALLRNPLSAIPPEAFSEKLVLARVAGRDSLYICDPALIQEALLRNADALGKGDTMRRVLGPAVGQGLLTADGAHWRWQRRAVAAGFQHDSLTSFLPAMIAAAEATRDSWLGKAGPLDIGQEMMRTTFAIIVETMLSGSGDFDAGKVEGAITDYLEPSNFMFAYSLLRTPEWLPYPGRRRALSSVAYLRETLGAIVAKRRASGEHRNDLVDMLLASADPESGRAMSDAEIVDNLLTFVTAGHETTALGLAWTFHLLSRHRAVEDAVLAEIEAVTGGDALKPEQVMALPLTRAVFQEAMRLYPPVPVITRQVEDAFQLGGVTLNKGMVLYVPIQAVHRHERLWDLPDRFEPARFLGEAARLRHRYAYLPFGAGPRICIGSAFATMEAVAILAVLLRAIRLEPLTQEPPEPTLKITLRPKRPLLMTATAR